MTSFLLTLFSQYNHRLKCEPPLTKPFDHCSFSNHVPKIFKFCTKNYNIVTIFWVQHTIQTPLRSIQHLHFIHILDMVGMDPKVMFF